MLCQNAAQKSVAAIQHRERVVVHAVVPHTPCVEHERLLVRRHAVKKFRRVLERVLVRHVAKHARLKEHLGDLPPFLASAAQVVPVD